MKIAFLSQMKSKGFTLIELLVVIGILGILAAALVATLDPFEQLKKAQDTTLKDEAVEFLSANTRYYATHTALPWFSTASGGAGCYSTGTTLTGVALNNLSTCVSTLVSEGELKAGFSNQSNLNQLTVSNPNPQTGNATDAIVCFQPQSKAFQKDPNTKYLANGNNGISCKATGGTNACYWCAQ